MLEVDQSTHGPALLGPVVGYKSVQYSAQSTRGLLTPVVLIAVEVYLNHVHERGIYSISAAATAAKAADTVFTAADVVAVPPDPVDRIVAVGLFFIDLPAIGGNADASAPETDPV
jgi:hypothetical protein